MVGVGSIKHTESSGCSEVTAYHADIDFCLTGFRMCSRRWTSVDGNQYLFRQSRGIQYVGGIIG